MVEDTTQKMDFHLLCRETTFTYVATVHEKRSISAEPLSRKMQQVRLRNYSIIQMERPLQDTKKVSLNIAEYRGHKSTIIMTNV